MKKISLLLSIGLILSAGSALACTGISLRCADGSYFQARTIEWGSYILDSKLSIVPRGYSQTSFTPTGINGLKFISKYGYVGVSLVQTEIIAEGINEAGLSAGLFYFPNFGSYEDYKPELNSQSLADVQLVAWMLSQFSSVEEVKAHIGDVRVISIAEKGKESAQAIHWRVGDRTGTQIVIEIEGGKVNVYDNTVGVFTNSPGYKWHLQNLNNYVNLYPGAAESSKIGGQDIAAFGAGSGFLGLPGDVTPPSRFVRAALYVSTAPVRKTPEETLMQCFQILDNFNIPIGIEYPRGYAPDIPSATQWTSVIDLTHREFYYKTMYNTTIRKISLSDIDFSKVKYQSLPLEKEKTQPVEVLKF